MRDEVGEAGKVLQVMEGGCAVPNTRMTAGTGVLERCVAALSLIHI